MSGQCGPVNTTEMSLPSVCLSMRHYDTVEKPQSRCWETRVLVLALPQASCVTLQRAFYFSVLQFAQLWNGSSHVAWSPQSSLDVKLCYFLYSCINSSKLKVGIFSTGNDQTASSTNCSHVMNALFQAQCRHSDIAGQQMTILAKMSLYSFQQTNFLIMLSYLKRV